MTCEPSYTPDERLSRRERERLYAMYAEGLIEPWDLPPPTRRRRRKKNQSIIIKRALRAAVRAGLEPTGFRVANTGEVTVFTKKVAEEPTVAHQRNQRMGRGQWRGLG